MARRYDRRTTTFSPEGRLYQVEYAMEAIQNAGAAVGILTKEGVVLAAERKITSKLLDTSAVGVKREKLYRLDDHIACAVGGITADANVIINYLRVSGQRYLFSYNEPMPVEQMVRSVADLKQGYTQFGGQRPFGVSILYAGWDDQFGYQLYQSDPSGVYSGWKATAFGNNQQTAIDILKQDYKQDISLEDGIKLSIKVLVKAMDTTLDPEKVELATVIRDESKDKVVFKIMDADEMKPLLDAANEARIAEQQAAS